MRSVLGDVASPLIAGRPTLLLPLGSCHQHGPHLPVGSDTTIAESVAQGIAERAGTPPPVLVAPALRYGASAGPDDVPGTLAIGGRALTDVLLEVGRSSGRWGGRLLVVNGHAGNEPAVVEAVLRLRDEGGDAAWLSGVPEGEPHGGRSEVSMMLALAPWTVRVGSSGDLGGACAEEGRRLLAGLVDVSLAALHAWCPAGNGRLRAPNAPDRAAWRRG
jgi:creatinine amidohydrolase/Fe(II)-dependent formamide hydrolase-like protein